MTDYAALRAAAQQAKSCNALGGCGHTKAEHNASDGGCSQCICAQFRWVAELPLPPSPRCSADRGFFSSDYCTRERGHPGSHMWTGGRG